MKKQLFDELLQSVKEASAIERRKLKAARVSQIKAKTDAAPVKRKS
jgi:hypothetical protein